MCGPSGPLSTSTRGKCPAWKITTNIENKLTKWLTLLTSDGSCWERLRLRYFHVMLRLRLMWWTLLCVCQRSQSASTTLTSPGSPSASVLRCVREVSRYIILLRKCNYLKYGLKEWAQDCSVLHHFETSQIGHKWGSSCFLMLSWSLPWLRWPEQHSSWTISF